MGQGNTVDTGLRPDPPRFPWLWPAPAVIVIVGTVITGVISYPSMPDALAVHQGANGALNRLAAKSVDSAFYQVFVQPGLTGLLVGLAAATFHSRPDLDPARPLASARWYRQYMSLGVEALFGLVAMIDVGMLGSSP